MMAGGGLDDGGKRPGKQALIPGRRSMISEHDS